MFDLELEEKMPKTKGVRLRPGQLVVCVDPLPPNRLRAGLKKGEYYQVVRLGGVDYPNDHDLVMVVSLDKPKSPFGGFKHGRFRPATGLPVVEE